jgi:hypothetical protein
VTFHIGHTSLSNPDSRTMATERYCKACRGWYEACLNVCPYCEAPRPEFNLKWRKPLLDRQLYDAASRAR